VEHCTEMGTISSAFYLVTGALEADQSALDVVANNVANANTPGYTREVPNWNENVPVEINGASYGTGVSQTGPTSVRDRVLEERLAQQQQSASGSAARLAALDSVLRVRRRETLEATSPGSLTRSRRWRRIRRTHRCEARCWPRRECLRGMCQMQRRA
jgi:hypothetical protein